MTLPTLAQVSEALVALGTLASLLATVLPSRWAVTRMLARWATDVRGIHQAPEPPKDAPPPAA